MRLGNGDSTHTFLHLRRAHELRSTLQGATQTGMICAFSPQHTKRDGQAHWLHHMQQTEKWGAEFRVKAALGTSLESLAGMTYSSKFSANVRCKENSTCGRPPAPCLRSQKTWNLHFSGNTRLRPKPSLPCGTGSLRLLPRTVAMEGARVPDFPSMSLHDKLRTFRESRAKLKEELAELREKVRREEGQGRSLPRGTSSGRGRGQTSWTPRERDTGVVLYHHHANGAVLCRKYLRWRAASTRRCEDHIERMLEHIRTVQPAKSIDLIGRVAWWTRRASDAAKYVREDDLHERVQKENDISGFAPSTHFLCAMEGMEGLPPVLPNGAPRLPQGVPLPKRLRQWTRRWAKRFKIRRGRLQSKKTTSKQDVTEKAPKTHLPSRQIYRERPKKVHPRTDFPAPEKRPYSGTRNWSAP